MKTKNLLFAIASIALLNSCSIEKRHYRSGYYFNNTEKNKSEIRDEIVKQSEPTKSVIENKIVINEPEDLEDANLFASINEAEPLYIEKPQPLNYSQVKNHKEQNESFKAELKNGYKKIKSDNDKRMSGMAVAGFIVSLLGLFLFGILMGLIGIIFSAIGLAKINKNQDKFKGKGLAVAGLIIGIIDILVWIVIIALVI